MATEAELVDPKHVALIRPRFERLSAEWKEQSQYLSNTAQMAMLPSYQRIVGMGWPVVPLILKSLEHEPDHWFWALEAITEQNPVPPELEGHVADMADRWVAWGREQGILAP